MDVRIAVLADYASISEGNKLNILGIFRAIMAPSEPVVHSQMQVVAQLEFNSSETGTKTFKTALVDADGREIFAISGEAVIPRAPHGGPSLLNHVLNLNNVVFPRFGDYEFRILLDGVTHCTIPLTVVKTVQPRES